MTEGYPPGNSEAHPEHETTALPRPDSSGWDALGASSNHEATTGTIGVVAAKVAAAGTATLSAAATATAAAKEALKAAAAESERGAQTSRPGPIGNRPPRRARLTLSHINVYSVFKFSCVLAIALFFVWLIMVGVLYGLLEVSGVLDKVNRTVKTISGEGSKDLVTATMVFGSAIIIGAVDILLFIGMSTIGSMVYNLCADLVGGAEVTLSERE